MHIAFDVSGYYDWEPAELHPGVQITQADVKALRAKVDAQGKWLIRVEKTQDTVHGAHIPETSLCGFIIWQAVHAGNEWSRHDAACELMKHSYKHHGRQDHIKDAHVAHDGGASEEIGKATVERCITEYREQLEAEALAQAGVHVTYGKVTREDGSQREETFSEALARTEGHPDAEEALGAQAERISATLASAQRSADAALARYLAKHVSMHAHVKAHFTSHVAKEQP